MKRFNSPDSLGALLCPPPQDIKNEKNNAVYSREFQAILDGLDEEDSAEENVKCSSKKRRLSYDQVKALERIFEVDNKLEPEQKTKLAQELGLQPRQVAIWFQNRRARWKTKQLEKDYNLLKSNYEALKLNYDKHQQEREALISEVKELKAKIGEGKTEDPHSVKQEDLFLDTNNTAKHSKGVSEEPEPTRTTSELCSNRNLMEIKGLMDFKDGLSDSDSSGVLNEDGNFNCQLLMSSDLGSARNDCSSLHPWIESLQFSDSMADMRKSCEHLQFGKMEEEQDLMGTEESGSIFSVDQAPTLQWNYFYNDQINL